MCYHFFCMISMLFVIFFFFILLFKLLFSCVFFFFKKKTAYLLRISDWSSDVCSSDLVSSNGTTHADSGVLPLPFGTASIASRKRRSPVAGLYSYSQYRNCFWKRSSRTGWPKKSPSPYTQCFSIHLQTSGPCVGQPSERGALSGFAVVEDLAVEDEIGRAHV